MWPAHVVVERGIFEMVVVVEDMHDGAPAIVSVPRKPVVAWWGPGRDPTGPWTRFKVGDKGGDWHGLGAGDVDGDGRTEIVTRGGVYSTDGDVRRPWRWTALRTVVEGGEVVEGLGDVGIIHVARLQREALPNLVAGSPHGIGLWWWELEEATKSAWTYRRHTIDHEVSQVHAIVIGTRGDEVSIFYGKRWQAHGPDGDVNPRDDPVVVRQRAARGAWDNPSREIIDSDSGVGLQIALRDDDGRWVLATSNKRGLHLFAESPARRRGVRRGTRKRSPEE